MAKYQQKSIVVDAVLWDGASSTANAFIGEAYGDDWVYRGPGSSDILIPTSKGELLVEYGDYIVKGAAGEFFAYRADTFFEMHAEGDAPTDSERVIHTIMDAMSIVSGRSPSDRETALRILRRAIDIADNTGVTHDTVRQLRNMETDLGN